MERNRPERQGTIGKGVRTMAGQAMIALAVKVLSGETIGDTVDLGVDGYTAMRARNSCASLSFSSSAQ